MSNGRRMPVVGEKIKDSSVGPGVLTGFDTDNWPLVDGKRAGYVIMEEGGSWDMFQDEASY